MKTKLFSSLLLAALFVFGNSGCQKKAENAGATKDSGAVNVAVKVGHSPISHDTMPGQPGNSFVTNQGSTPATEFGFLNTNPGGIWKMLTQSPSGNMAWFEFYSIMNPPPTTTQTVSWNASQIVGVDSFQVLYAPAANGAAPFPTATVVTNGSVVPLPGGARSLLVPVYKLGNQGPWIPFDNVTVTTSPANTSWWGNGPGASTGTITCTFKSASNVSSAVITISVNSSMPQP